MSIFSLSILTPLALLGLLAMAIPIYLHMRHKPRAEVFRFPAMDFLLKAQRKRKRRFKVEQWLLMLFRLAIVGALAFLFAKPFIDETIEDLGLSRQVPLVILLDDSLSMLAKQGESSFFDEAVSQIDDVLSKRPSSAPTYLLPASNPSSLIQIENAGELRGQLRQLKPTTLAATLDEAYTQTLSLVETKGWPKATLRVFTDGSRSAWQQFPTQKPEKVEVVYANLRNTDRPLRNVGIASVQQAPGDRRTLEVGLVNGGAERININLNLEADGQPPVRQALQVRPFGGINHRFGLPESMPPTLTMRIPPDDFTFDDEVVYAPGSAASIRVLIVDGDSHPDAIASESFFFKNALGLEESAKYGFEQEVITAAGLDAQKIAAADVICLFNVDAVDPSLLSGALAKGKGVFITMGDLMNPESWKPFFSPFEMEVWETKSLPEMLPVEIKEFDHPFFQPVEESEWRNYLQGVGVSKIRILTIGRSRATIPLALPDSTPLLIAKDTNPGRLMVWTASIDMDWTNFPLQFGYVPFVRQVLAYLSDQGAATTVAQLTVDEVAGSDLQAALAPKYLQPGFEGVAISGPLPGVYTRQVANKTEFVQVSLSPDELNFQSFQDQGGEGDGGDPLAKAGFQNYSRADLGPSIQWLVFALLLMETLVAGRFSLKWGAR